MQVRAERGELRITRETFAEHFDAWLKGHHRASKSTRDGYRAAGEWRLKPFFGPMRLSAIDVPTVRDFAAEMVELVEAGELAPKTVNSNPCEHIAHLPESHWGYVFKGSFRVTYVDGDEEIITTGQAYHLRPGHFVQTLEPVELLELSPVEEHDRTMATLAKNLGLVVS